MPYVTPSDRQQAFLHDLYRDTKADTPGAPSFDTWKQQIIDQGQWTYVTVSQVISQLQSRRRQMNADARRSLAASVRPTPENTSAPAPSAWVDGHHLIDGSIYHVHPFTGRRGRLYPEGRQVHMLDVHRLTDTGRARWIRLAYAYDPSSQRYARRLPTFTTQTLLTPEGVAHYAAHHGFCGICGRTLTVAESVERGVGPICWRRVQSYATRMAAVIDAPHDGAVV